MYLWHTIQAAIRSHRKTVARAEQWKDVGGNYFVKGLQQEFYRILPRIGLDCCFTAIGIHLDLFDQRRGRIKKRSDLLSFVAFLYRSVSLFEFLVENVPPTPAKKQMSFRQRGIQYLRQYQSHQDSLLLSFMTGDREQLHLQGSRVSCNFILMQYWSCKDKRICLKKRGGGWNAQ